MMAAGQLNNGVHVAAVIEPTAASDHPFITRLESAGVPVTRIVVGARSYATEYRALRELIARVKPDVVHTHGYRADIIGGVAARSNNVATVSTLHGFTGGSAKNRFNELIQSFALRRADAVIAVSAPIVERLARAGVPRFKIRCLPNGFKPGERLNRLDARRQLALDDKQFVIGWVGRLSAEKGADVMLQALAQCDQRCHLSIVGDGPERDTLQRLSRDLGVAPRVTWHGEVPDAGKLFAAFDAFVLSSRTEGTPISLFEAMDAEVPIVATSVGGVPDVVSSAQAILVPSERPTEIARSLAEVQRDPSGARERALDAKQRLLSDFSVAPWLAAVEATYAAAVSAARSR